MSSKQQKIVVRVLAALLCLLMLVGILPAALL